MIGESHRTLAEAHEIVAAEDRGGRVGCWECGELATVVIASDYRRGLPLCDEHGSYFGARFVPVGRAHRDDLPAIC